MPKPSVVSVEFFKLFRIVIARDEIDKAISED